jgi:hypothetical protein
MTRVVVALRVIRPRTVQFVVADFFPVDVDLQID